MLIFENDFKVASCALPAAGVLAWYLLQPSSRTGLGQLDPSSRRQSVENLSVLIAHMGILHDPGDGNYQLFCQAKSALQSAMDTILQPSSSADHHSESPLDNITNPPTIPPDWIYSDYLGLGVDSWLVLFLGHSNDYETLRTNYFQGLVYRIAGLSIDWMRICPTRSLRSLYVFKLVLIFIQVRLCDRTFIS